MKNRPPSVFARHLRRAASTLLELAAAGAFLAVFAHHVAAIDFRPLAAFCLPVMVAMVGFTSLLFVRGNSLRRGRVRVRTLYAAERSMQATVWYFTGIVLGLGMVGVLQVVPGLLDPASAGWVRLVLVVFLVPYALMQCGMILFLRAAWAIAPHLLRRVSAHEAWRRVRETDPGNASNAPSCAGGLTFPRGQG